MHIQSSNYPDCARAIHHHLLDRIASVICGRQINDIAISGCCDPAADPAPYPPLLSRNWGSESIQHRREGKKEAKRERERERERGVPLRSIGVICNFLRVRRRRWAHRQTEDRRRQTTTTTTTLASAVSYRIISREPRKDGEIKTEEEKKQEEEEEEEVEEEEEEEE